jgi:membrane protease subunit HflK
MMQSVLATTPKVVVDQRGGGNLLYLPLDRLIQAAGAHRRTGERRAATHARRHAQSRALTGETR